MKEYGLYLFLGLGILLFAGCKSSSQVVDASFKKTPTQVCAEYFDAMENSNLDKAGLLFVSNSSIFETGGEEGNWDHYRDHHIGPEIDQILEFKISRGQPEEQISADNSMAFVAWPIGYGINLKGGRKIKSKGTVTFVLIRENGTYRIQHLHWSSRKLSDSKK